MVCPFCKNADTKVVDKRDSSDTTTRRRRECERCAKRFTTYERVENVVLNVIKRDGKIEEFDRDKIKRGLMKAVSKRHIPEERIDEMITEIEHYLMNSDKQVIRTVDIGEMVLSKLTQIDKLGALLFASVYKEFKSLEEVQQELKRLEQKNINKKINS